MDNEITATVNAANVPRIQKIVDRINKKLASFELALVLFTWFIRTEARPGGRTASLVADITLTLPEIESGTGWRLVAIFKPGVTESYSYLLPGAEESDIPEAYRNQDAETAAHCEHCGWNRRRNTTVLLRNDAEDKWIRVGSTCVADFLGGGADKVLSAIRALDRIRKELAEPREIAAETAYSAKLIAAVVTDMLIAGHHYINASDARDQGVLSTAKSAKILIDGDGAIVDGSIEFYPGYGSPEFVRRPYTPSDRAVAFVEKALEWLPKHLDEVDADRDRSYHRNLETAFEFDGDGAGFVTVKSGGFGTAASFPVFAKKHAPQGRNSKRANAAAQTAQLAVGKRYNLTCEITWTGQAFRSEYSREVKTVRRYVARDSEGRMLTWFGRSDLAVKGDHLDIRARVKDLSEYHGVTQFVLHYVRVQ